MELKATDPLAVSLTHAIRSGEVEALRPLLAQNPGLAKASVLDGRGCARTPLHLLTDWPGNFPNGAAMARVLVDAGADVNSRFRGAHGETPLHWTASSDDMAVLDALLDLGADIEAPGAVIAGGTPLADAVAFGQWKVARRLIERGALSNLWQSAALGLMDRVRSEFEGATPPAEEITKAFWLACHGGQRGPAEYLLDRGADINWVGYDRLTPLGAARRSNADPELLAWLESRGARPVKAAG